MDVSPSSRQAIRPPRAAQKFGFSLATLWRKTKEDPTFPQPVKISANITIFFEDEIDQYLSALAAKSRSPKTQAV